MGETPRNTHPVWTVILLAWAAFLVAFQTGGLYTLASRAANDLQLSFDRIAWIMGGPITLVTALAAIGVAVWSDFGRGNRALIIAIGLGLIAAGLAALAMAQTEAHLIIGRVVSMIGLGFAATLPRVLLSDRVPRQWLATSFAALIAMTGLGFIFGPALMGVAATMDWRGGLNGLAICFVLTAVLVGVAVTDQRAPPPATPANIAAAAAPLLLLVLGAVVLSIVRTGMITMFLPAVMGKFGPAISEISMVMAASSALGVTGIIVGAVIADLIALQNRAAYGYIAAGAAALMVLALALLAVAQDMIGVTLAYALFGLAGGACEAPLYAALITISPARWRGRVIVLAYTGTFIGGFGVPLAFLLFDAQLKAAPFVAIYWLAGAAMAPVLLFTAAALFLTDAFAARARVGGDAA